uniref:hypothetical protein n=1 Tax=Aliarcobacter sp. TaxID=2321116 RepID=UPI004048DF4B
MSLNQFSEETIKSVSKTLIEIIKEEEKFQIKDMKTYLNKTNISDDEKIKIYTEFSSRLFESKINTVSSVTQNYIIKDKELLLQKNLSEVQIDLEKTKDLVAKQEELLTKERILLTKEQINQAKEEINLTKIKMWLSGAEAQVKLTNTVSSTLSEARRNGATVTKDIKSFTLPVTGQTISFAHLSLAAAESTDTTKGLIGTQMAQLIEQSKTFKDHSKVQIANQIMQLGSTAIADGLTNISGLLGSHKSLSENIVGTGILSSNYTTIG